MLRLQNVICEDNLTFSVCIYSLKKQTIQQLKKEYLPSNIEHELESLKKLVNVTKTSIFNWQFVVFNVHAKQSYLDQLRILSINIFEEGCCWKSVLQAFFT